MKRVGIVTYKDIADGKGRFFQAFALYSAIRVLGYEPEIIDYYPARVRRSLLRVLRHPISYGGVAIGMLANKMVTNELVARRRKYCEFIRENMRVTHTIQSYDAIKAIGQDYDAYVCGSDQIWNPRFSGLDPAYYLQFADRAKRIAYAPSLGTKELTTEELVRIGRMAGDIPHLSVRERWGAEMLSGYLGRPVLATVDPTLLMPRDWWNELASDPVEKGPYVLTLWLDNSSYPRRVAAEVAKRLGRRVVCIADALRDLGSRQKKIDVGPRLFLSLFLNAEFVCTQSFHGTILSILYNRPFYVFNRQTKFYVSGVFARIEDLLDRMNLADRILTPGQPLGDLSQLPDYGQVNAIVERERASSLAFLKDSLARATSGGQHA